MIATAQKDPDALKKANEYFAMLADEKSDKPEAKKARDREKDLTDKGLPPDFPGAPTAAWSPSAAEIAAAAAVPPLGLGEQVAGGVILSHATTPPRPTAPRYRWVRIAQERELSALFLDPLAAKSQLRKKWWDEAKKARGKEVYVHTDVDWLIYSRERADKSVDFSVLVKEPEGAALVSGADVIDVLPRAGKVTVLLSPEGAAQLAKFTKEYQGTDAAPRFAGVILDDQLIEILRVTQEIANGQFEVGGDLKPDEVTRLANNIKRSGRQP